MVLPLRLRPAQAADSPGHLGGGNAAGGEIIGGVRRAAEALTPGADGVLHVPDLLEDMPPALRPRPSALIPQKVHNGGAVVLHG